MALHKDDFDDFDESTDIKSIFDDAVEEKWENEINDYLNNIPELLSVIGETNVRRLLQATDSTIGSALQQCFHSLMTCDSNEVARQLKSLLNRLHNAGTNFYI